MPDVAVIIALVLSSGSLVVSITSFVLAINAHRARRRCRPVSAGMSSGNAHSHGDEMMKSHEGQ